MNWRELATTSQYQTAVAIKQELMNNHIEEALHGTEELIEALSRSDKRALRRQVIRLMAHVLQWKTQPERRSQNRAVSIENARIEIEELLEIEPSLQPSFSRLLRELFAKAKRLAEKEMNSEVTLTELSWRECFEDDYTLKA